MAAANAAGGPSGRPREGACGIDIVGGRTERVSAVTPADPRVLALLEEWPQKRGSQTACSQSHIEVWRRVAAEPDEARLILILEVILRPPATSRHTQAHASTHKPTRRAENGRGGGGGSCAHTCSRAPSLLSVGRAASSAARVGARHDCCAACLGTVCELCGWVGGWLQDDVRFHKEWLRGLHECLAELAVREAERGVPGGAAAQDGSCHGGWSLFMLDAFDQSGWNFGASRFNKRRDGSGARFELVAARHCVYADAYMLRPAAARQLLQLHDVRVALPPIRPSMHTFMSHRHLPPRN